MGGKKKGKRKSLPANADLLLRYPWTEHHYTHYSMMLDGERLHFWPTTNKYRHGDRGTKMGDVADYIRRIGEDKVAPLTKRAARKALKEHPTTIEEIVQWCEAVCYKPGWQFSVSEVGEHALLYVCRTMMCAVHGDEIQGYHNIELGHIGTMDEANFLQAVKRAITEIEMHERDEWLYYGDDRVTAVHREPEKSGALEKLYANR